jgi:hypothetical protein
MDIKSFPNPKLNLPKELKNPKDEAKNKSFNAVDYYIPMVGKYIYTEIDLNYEASDPIRAHAWIQKVVSSLVLRSLYLRNEFVENINSGNAVAFYLPLKAWFEITGALASILELLEKQLSAEELSEEMKPFALGNKYKGELKVGSIEAKNVLTMIEKGNKYLDNMSKEIEGNKLDTPSETFFTDYYDTASNASHPSFDAHEIIGSLGEDGVWRAKELEKVKDVIITDLPGYGGLLMASLFIDNICKKIFELEKDNFAKVKSKKYFD